MVLGGAISLLVGFLVLAAAALVILGVWLLLGRREDRPLRNPFTAYLGIVIFISLMTALASARVVVSSIGSALADYPVGSACNEPEFLDDPEYRIGEAPPPGIPPVDLEKIRDQLQSEASVGADAGSLVAVQGPDVPSRPPQPATPTRPPFGPSGPGDCKVISARDRAAVQAAEGGTALIVSLGILMFHARAGRRLLDEETSDA